MSSFDTKYSPAEIEQRQYQRWLSEKLFEAVPTSPKPPYCIMIPPPNVTGSLHMGHAFNNTLQDILCRFKRMTGHEVLWMPGTDHAGIATQNVVERELAKEGKKKEDLGREGFLERVWAWKETSGNTILKQLQRLGCSCDWSRTRFTMDEGLSRAVREAFVRLYNEGLIYRGEYIVNWCPRCTSAISDLEVNHKDLKGKLWHLKYEFADGSGFIEVATTRPETIFGDVAVAVHPDDERHKGKVGKKVRIPFINREIPIIADSYVDMTFGSGGLKITPGHDTNDFEIGRKHKLPIITAMDELGRMNKEAGPYAGLDRFKCRKQVVADLEANGLLIKEVENPYKLGHCQRCDTVVEPRVSPQWFVSTKGMAEKSIAAVREGNTNIVPENWTKTYYNWMENIRDWCISRQLWWGHRIPVYTCGGCKKQFASVDEPSACACGSKQLTQDPDVLDTWFSSGLWPFSTLGWPDNTPDLKKFFPTTVLVTGFDILFFWVARMMMFSTHLLKSIPFHTVYLHALVRDEHGQKMSKSKGNVLDPLVLIEKFGADAVRFTLTILAIAGRDVPLSESRIDGYRNFLNKIWNATRFALMNLEGRAERVDEAKLALPDRWIRSRMSAAIEAARVGMEEYRFNEVADAQYKFFWDEFCAWYVEICKVYFKDPVSGPNVKANLLALLETSLKLMHPVIPFVTEELWAQLPGTRGAIMSESFPQATDFKRDLQAEKEMDIIQRAVEAVRNIRAELHILPKAELDLVVAKQHAEMIVKHSDFIVTLCKLKSVKTGTRPAGAVSKVVDGLELYLVVAGHVDVQAERARLDKERAKLAGDAERIEKLLADESFIARAPEDVVTTNREKATHAKQALARVQESLQALAELG